MSEQILHRAQIGAPLEKVGGEAVAEGMRKGRHVLANHGADAPGAERAPLDPHPKGRPCLGPGQSGPALVEIAANRLLGGPADRDTTCLPAFAHDGDHISAHVVDRERGQLRDTQPGGVEGVDQRTIPETFSGGRVDGLDGMDHGPGGEGVGKRAVQPGPGDPLERVDRGRAAAPGVVVERAHRRCLSRHRALGIPLRGETGQEATGMSPFDGLDRPDALAVAKGEELGQVASVGLDGVR